MIDELCLLCPFSLTRSKGAEHKQYSDHNTIMIESVLERYYGHKEKTKPEEIIPRWRIKDEGLVDFLKITNNNEHEPVSTYDQFEMYLKNCMDKCFKPVSKKIKPHVKMNFQYQSLVTLLMKYYRGGKIQRKVVKKFM